MQSACHPVRSEEAVFHVQNFLITADLLEDGSADGEFGAQTAQALKVWQESVELTPNGLPDMVTLFLMAQRAKE